MTNHRSLLNEKMQDVLRESVAFNYAERKLADGFLTTLKIGECEFEGEVSFSKSQARNSAAKAALDKIRSFFDEIDLRNELGLEARTIV